MEALNKVETYVEQTITCGKPSKCNTKVKLHNVVLDNKDLKSTITSMEEYMRECGVLVGWEENKDKYL